MRSSCHGIESIVSHLGHKVATNCQRIGSTDQYYWFPGRPRAQLQSEAVSGNEGRVEEMQTAGRSRGKLGDADHSRLRVRLAKSSKPSAPINHGLTAPPPPPLVAGGGLTVAGGEPFTVSVAVLLKVVPYALVTATV